jgi:hypothetical protein
LTSAIAGPRDSVERELEEAKRRFRTNLTLAGVGPHIIEGLIAESITGKTPSETIANLAKAQQRGLITRPTKREDLAAYLAGGIVGDALLNRYKASKFLPLVGSLTPEQEERLKKYEPKEIFQNGFNPRYAGVLGKNGAPVCRVCGKVLSSLDEEGDRYYCYSDDQIYLGKEQRWRD